MLKSDAGARRESCWVRRSFPKQKLFEREKSFELVSPALWRQLRIEKLHQLWSQLSLLTTVVLCSDTALLHLCYCWLETKKQTSMVSLVFKCEILRTEDFYGHCCKAVVAIKGRWLCGWVLLQQS